MNIGTNGIPPRYALPWSLHTLHRADIHILLVVYLDLRYTRPRIALEDVPFQRDRQGRAYHAAQGAEARPGCAGVAQGSRGAACSRMGRVYVTQYTPSDAYS